MFRFDPDTHRYTLGDLELDSVTGILTAEGFIDTRFYDEWSRTRGSYVHEATHLYDRGELDEDALDPQLVPYLEAYKKFLKETGAEILESEIPYYHPEYLYAGRPDKKALLFGTETTIEIKSGNIEPWARIQAASYMLLNGTKKACGLQLKPDGSYKLHEFKDRKDIHLWLSILAVHNWKKNNLRRSQWMH